MDEKNEDIIEMENNLFGIFLVDQIHKKKHEKMNKKAMFEIVTHQQYVSLLNFVYKLQRNITKKKIAKGLLANMNQSIALERKNNINLSEENEVQSKENNQAKQDSTESIEIQALNSLEIPEGYGTSPEKFDIGIIKILEPEPERLR